MSVVENRVLRVEDGRFLRGEGQYVENIPLENPLAVTFVRSLLAHANIDEVIRVLTPLREAWQIAVPQAAREQHEAMKASESGR